MHGGADFGGRGLDYRLYFLDAQGHVRERLDLECEDDDHAARLAQTRADGRDMELWRRALLIRKFPGSRLHPPP